MKLTATYPMPAPRANVYSQIIDPMVLQQCIDGCEKMVLTAPDSYDAHLKIGIGGVKGQYLGKVQLKDKLPPESYTLLLEGKGGPGFVKGSARIRLEDQGDRTLLQCEADVQVGGLIAAIGSRLIEATAKKLMDSFFQKFTAHLQSQSPNPTPHLGQS